MAHYVTNLVFEDEVAARSALFFAIGPLRVEVAVKLLFVLLDVSEFLLDRGDVRPQSAQLGFEPSALVTKLIHFEVGAGLSEWSRGSPNLS